MQVVRPANGNGKWCIYKVSNNWLDFFRYDVVGPLGGVYGGAYTLWGAKWSLRNTRKNLAAPRRVRTETKVYEEES